MRAKSGPFQFGSRPQQSHIRSEMPAAIAGVIRKLPCTRQMGKLIRVLELQRELLAEDEPPETDDAEGLTD